MISVNLVPFHLLALCKSDSSLPYFAPLPESVLSSHRSARQVTGAHLYAHFDNNRVGFVTGETSI